MDLLTSVLYLKPSPKGEENPEIYRDLGVEIEDRETKGNKVHYKIIWKGGKDINRVLLFYSLPRDQTAQDPKFIKIIPSLLQLLDQKATLVVYDYPKSGMSQEKCSLPLSRNGMIQAAKEVFWEARDLINPKRVLIWGNDVGNHPASHLSRELSENPKGIESFATISMNPIQSWIPWVPFKVDEELLGLPNVLTVSESWEYMYEWDDLRNWLNHHLFGERGWRASSPIPRKEMIGKKSLNPSNS